jgi:hypothetical protein
MKRVASFIGLCFLILVVILIYCYLYNPERMILPNQENPEHLMEALEVGKEFIVMEHNAELYIFWSFIAMFILVFLKITWKLIIYNWSEQLIERQNKPSH